MSWAEDEGYDADWDDYYNYWNIRSWIKSQSQADEEMLESFRKAKKGRKLRKLKRSVKRLI